jgi:hypothetical protein
VPLLLVAWTVAIWTVRIRNIATSDAGVGALVVPVVLTALAIAALVDRRRGSLALAAATIVVWAVRVPLVLVHDHGAAFKLVHVALALVSVGLAVTVLRRDGARRSGRRPGKVATS